MLTEFQRFHQLPNHCSTALAPPRRLAPLKRAKEALQQQVKTRTSLQPPKEAAQKPPQSESGARNGKNLRETLIFVESVHMDGLNMTHPQRRTQQIVQRPLVPPQSGFIKRMLPLIRIMTLRGIR